MGIFTPAPLYPIVDVLRGDTTRPLELATALVAAGCPWLQLRAKETSAADHVVVARRFVDLARGRGTRIIVNDRLDVAVASGAHGVHLGQGDLPLSAARAVATRHGLVVGISTHDVAQARAAAAQGADYVGFGPMFATDSKADALAPRAPGVLPAVREAVRIPIVAIGGITEATAPDVLRQGADAVAMIGALTGAADPAALARRLLRLSTRPQSS